MSDLRTRLAATLADTDGMPWDMWSKPSQDGYLLRADAVIAELDLGIPCAANGCKVRRIAKYHAEKSSQLSRADND
jgi:hypothetical protein